MRKPASNYYVLENLIEQMWEIRDKVRADPNNRALEQKWIFVRRVVARSLVLRERRSR